MSDSPTWYGCQGWRCFRYRGVRTADGWQCRLERVPDNHGHTFLMPATAKLYYSDWVEVPK